MWWSKFLGSPDGISHLSRPDLENLFRKSIDEMERIRFANKYLETEIKELEIQIRRKGISEKKNHKNMNGIDSDTNPTFISASNQRLGSLIEKREQLKGESNEIQKIIVRDSRILKEMNKEYSHNQPFPKDSLKIGAFNNTDLRKISSLLFNMEGEGTLFIKLIEDILNMDNTKVSMRIIDMEDSFIQTCIDLDNKLSLLISESNKINEYTSHLQSSISDSIQNYSFSLDTQNVLSEVGQENEPLKDIQIKISSMKQKLEEINNDVLNLKDSSEHKPVLAPASDISNSIKLRRELQDLDMSTQNLTKRQKIITEQINRQFEFIQKLSNEMNYDQQKINEMKLSLENTKRINNLIKTSQITPQYAPLILSYSSKQTPYQIYDSVMNLKKELTNLERQEKGIQRRISQLFSQNSLYNQQISELETLIGICISQKDK